MQEGSRQPGNINVADQFLTDPRVEHVSAACSIQPMAFAVPQQIDPSLVQSFVFTVETVFRWPGRAVNQRGFLLGLVVLLKERRRE